MTAVSTTLGPRPFILQRHIDVSGISGIGPIAEGVEWSDGTVSLRWKGDTPSTTFWQAGIAAVEAVHGHGGATTVRYLAELRADNTNLECRR
jgi:hypothetical protein